MGIRAAVRILHSGAVALLWINPDPSKSEQITCLHWQRKKITPAASWLWSREAGPGTSQLA